MSIFRDLIIEDAAYAMDGGSIYLALRDSNDVSHALILVQHQIPMAPNNPRIPGRLYLDNRVIEIRSDEERQLIAEIKDAPISPIPRGGAEPGEQPHPVYVVGGDIAEYLEATQISPEAAIQHLVNALVQFVESEEYIRLAS